MRVLLTGASGFIGSHLARVLEARGDVVVRVSRRGPVRWDSIAEEVPRADAVVHLAGEPIAAGRWTPEQLERIRSSRVDTTSAIARAIVDSARKPGVWVSGSAVGIYGMRRDDAVCDESHAPGEDVLARLVVAWEAAAAPARAASVRVVHPRIGVVLGDGGALARMLPPFSRFVGGPLGAGHQSMSWVHVGDVVRALLFLLDRPSLSGPFNVVAPEAVSMNDFAATLGHVMRRPALLRVPAFALRLALGAGLAEMLLTGQHAVPLALERAGFVFEWASLEAALNNLLSSR
ncbi:MAG TPA: TIGR01777 family oxidoreductase [Polyangiaceae bacterium]|nr:TIGR01777 family oxidoreductase [Polyangiaceae bacterium]